jgi:uncharacterized protein (DUF2461 family)
MRDRPEDIRAVTDRFAAAGLSFDTDDALQKAPRGFDDVEDPDLIALLRLKSLIVRRTLAMEIVGDADRLIEAWAAIL